MNELALFSGAGGGILGGVLLGWRTVCAVEQDHYCCTVLAQRQNDGILPPFPIWCGDIRDFRGEPWRGIVDVVSGGFPCQDISAAGKGTGIDGAKSGLWREMARIVGEVRPSYVFVENSPLLVGRGLARVLSDLAKLGFDARWGVIGADDCGAPHIRKRLWLVANAVPSRQWWKRRESEASGSVGGDAAEDANSANEGVRRGQQQSCSGEGPRCLGDWPIEPALGRVAHGVAKRVDRLRALGNGQVPRVAATAWRILTNDFPTPAAPIPGQQGAEGKD